MQNENVIFGTPLWKYDLDIPNDVLDREGRQYVSGNYFDLPGETISKLKYTVKNH